MIFFVTKARCLKKITIKKMITDTSMCVCAFVYVCMCVCGLTLQIEDGGPLTKIH